MAPIPATEKICSVCDGAFAPEDLALFGEHSVCAGRQPGFVQSLRQGMAEPLAPKEVHYAGFWIRVCAQLVDLVILTAFRLLPAYAAWATAGGLSQAVQTDLTLMNSLCHYRLFLLLLDALRRDARKDDPWSKGDRREWGATTASRTLV